MPYYPDTGGSNYFTGGYRANATTSEWRWLSTGDLIQYNDWTTYKKPDGGPVAPVDGECLVVNTFTVPSWHRVPCTQTEPQRALCEYTV